MAEKQQFRTLNIDGSKYKTLFTRKYRNRRDWADPDPRKVLSFIPGVVLEIFVKEGDPVKKGDELIILEAMKMRNRVLSPMDGVVKLINVKTGDKIAKSSLIMILDEN